jgi:DNA processing protein
MDNMYKRKHWLGLIKLQGLGPGIIKNLLDFFGSAKAIWKADIKELSKVKLIGPKRSRQIIKDRKSINLDYELERLQELEVKYLTLRDKDYPFLLKNIHNPPPVLFYKGEIRETDLISLAIVGSRKCTTYGRKVAKRLAIALAKKGITIVSGLARGVDTYSHLGALEAGRTISVIGSGIDVIYPPENEDLMNRITKHGAVISSFPLSTPPNGSNFPQRNRIISGLTLGTIVVEAVKKSGALITANFALEQGREVFAIPGDITREQSLGTNDLIKKGAKLVQDIDDILLELPLEVWEKEFNIEGEALKKDKKDLELTDEEQKIYEELSFDSQELNEILMKVELSASKLNSVLLKLEVKGLVERLAGNRFILSS